MRPLLTSVKAKPEAASEERASLTEDSCSLCRLNLAASVLTVRPRASLFLVTDQRPNAFLLWAIVARLFVRCLSRMTALV